MNNQFRKKPVVIEAVQFDGTLVSLEGMAIPEVSQSMGSDNVQIPTLEGVMTTQPGDWIIRGVKGEFYPCKPDIFAATYARATEAATPAPDDELPPLPEPRAIRAGHSFPPVYALAYTTSQLQDYARDYAKVKLDSAALRQPGALPDEAEDAARLRWLIEDHDDADTRDVARQLASRLGTSSYFAITRDIDAARAAAKQAGN